MTLETIWIGVDPGLDGALCAIMPDGTLNIKDMPTIEEQGSRRVIRHVQGLEVRRWLDTLVQKGRLFAGVEKVGAMPKQDPGGAFTFGKGVGKVVGILESEMVAYEEITPQEWQKAILGASRAAPGKGKKMTDAQKTAAKKARKSSSRLKAQQLWPGQAEMFSRVKDDGRAEAALIAEHIRRKLTGQTLPEGGPVQLVFGNIEAEVVK